MKVAVIIDTWFPFIGGGQINAWEISRRLAAKGVKIDIITRDTGNNKLKIPNNLNVLKLGARVNYNDNFSKIVFLARSFFFIKNRDYDIVHAHAFLSGVTARLLMAFKGIPAVFTIHGTSLGTKLNSFLSRSIEKFILTQIRYTAQITVSRDFLTLKNVNKNIAYIPNGVNVKMFDKVKAKKFKSPTLIFVGRLHPQKNLKTLISAIDIVKKKIPKINLIIIGKGQLKNKLIKLVKSKNLQKNVKFLGERSNNDLIRLYKSSHIFILPSIYEGQPISLLEAWAAKLPVIVSKTGDCQFLVKENENGYLINDPTNANDITKWIDKALNNRNLSNLGENGYKLVKNQYSWEKSALLTFKVYEEFSNV